MFRIKYAVILCAATIAAIGLATPAAHAADVSFTAKANGKYVSAETGYPGSDNGMLRAFSVDPWSRFDLVKLGDCPWLGPAIDCDVVTLRSASNGRYVSAELGYCCAHYAMLRARSGSVGPWEKFLLYRNAEQANEYWIKSQANGKFVTTELAYAGAYHAELRAIRDGIGPNEKFKMLYF